jgi:hypothetical protein
VTDAHPRVHVANSRPAVSDAAHPDVSEQAVQPPFMTRLAPWTLPSFGPHQRRSGGITGPLFLTDRPQVEMVLQELPDQGASGVVEMFFQFGVGPLAGRRARQGGRQRFEGTDGAGERVRRAAPWPTGRP